MIEAPKAAAEGWAMVMELAVAMAVAEDVAMVAVAWAEKAAAANQTRLLGFQRSTPPPAPALPRCPSLAADRPPRGRC